MCGELKTYSPRTVRLLHKHTMHQASMGVNGAELVMQNMVEAYGYTYLEEANQRA